MHHRTALRALALTAALLATALVGVALAKTLTLKEAKNVKVMNNATMATTHATVVTNSKGLAVYTLTGDSSKHPKCTKANGCWQFWPPVKVKSAKGLSAATGIKGKLGTWKHNGFLQLTIAGHPLYTFFSDKKNVAGGDVLTSFGGTWHVRTPSGKWVSWSAPASSGSGSGYPPTPW
jgi:predicted lipoprotein with Yx(FWY)xxD motif